MRLNLQRFVRRRRLAEALLSLDYPSKALFRKKRERAIS